MLCFDFQWITTAICNLRCTHCYGAFGLPGKDELNTEEGKSVLKQFKKLVTSVGLSPDIHFSGGEPLLRRDIYELISYAKSIGINVTILSNGTLINLDRAKSLEQSGVSKIQISFEGSNRETHEFIRGKNTFVKSLNAVKILKENTNIDVSMAMTVMKSNLNEAESFVELCKEMRADRAVFHRFVPMGRGENISNQELTIAENKKFVEKYVELEENFGKKFVQYTDPLLYPVEFGEETNELELGGCSIGFSALSINYNGDVYPCPRVPFVIGNVRKNTLEEIWNNSAVLDKLRNRNNLKGKCGNCSFRFQCGGCRAVAFAVENDLFATDPGCWVK